MKTKILCIGLSGLVAFNAAAQQVGNYGSSAIPMQQVSTTGMPYATNGGLPVMQASADPLAAAMAEYDACEQAAATEAAAKTATSMKGSTRDMITQAISGGLNGIGSSVTSAFSGASVGSSITAGISAAGISECPANDTAPFIPTDKDNYCGEGQKFDKSALERNIRAFEVAASTASCKEATTAAAKKIVTQCFSKLGEKVKAAMQSEKKKFDAFVVESKKYESWVGKEVSKAGDNIKAASEKAKGISAAAANVQAVLDQMNFGGGKSPIPSAADLKKAVQGYKERKLSSENEVVRYRTNNLAACIEGGYSDSSVGCLDTAGNRTSPLQCAMQKVAESTSLKRRGGDASNGQTGADATAAGRDAASFKTEIMNLLAQLKTSGSGSARITTANGWLDSPGNKRRLEAYGVAGQIIRDQMMRCGSVVESDISGQSDGKHPESKLGSLKAALEEAETNTQALLGKAVSKMDEVWSDGLKEFTGQAASVSMDSCHKTASGGVVDFQRQINCISENQDTLQSLLDGKPHGTQTMSKYQPIQLASPTGQTQVCSGLKPCAELASTIGNNWKTYKDSLEGDKTFQNAQCGQAGCPGLQAFHKQVNAKIVEQLGVAQDFYAKYMTTMRAQFERMKSIMGRADLSFPEADAKRSSISEVCDSNQADKICELPTDFDKLIAGLSNMPNVDPRDFKDLAKESGDSAKQLAKDKQSAEDGIKKLAEISKKCENAGKKADAEKAITEKFDESDSILSVCDEGLARRTIDDQSALGVWMKGMADICKEYKDKDIKVSTCSTWRGEAARARESCHGIQDGKIQQKFAMERDECVEIKDENKKEDCFRRARHDRNEAAERIN